MITFHSLSRQEYFDATDDAQSLAAFWKNRHAEANNLLQATVEENERLLAAMDAAGLEVPEEVRTSDDPRWKSK